MNRYIVKGAQVRCSMGSIITRLDLPQSHGVYVNEKPVLIDTDSKAHANVKPFGKCKVKGKCNPALLPFWLSTKTETLINGRPALLDKSFLCCVFGGKIKIVSDGQLG